MVDIELLMQAHRNRQLAASGQWTLGELIDALRGVADPTIHVRFDFGHMSPTRLASWRGIYAELALSYESTYEGLTVAELLSQCESAVGRTFEGYKGGDFLMGLRTPIWVSNYGESDDTFVSGLSVTHYAAILHTKHGAAYPNE
jgi:hypothetical protein